MGFFGGGGSSVDLASPSAIGSTTPNTGAFTTLSFAPNNNTTGFSNTGNSLTGSNAQSLVSLAQTWNTTGTPSAIKLDVTNTASNSASLLMQLQTGGTNRFTVSHDGIGTFAGRISCGGSIAFRTNSVIESPTDETYNFRRGLTGSVRVQIGLGYVRIGDSGALEFNSSSASSASDLSIIRDAADILAQRRTTNAQTFRLYNTFTDASNYERGFFRWNTNVLEIGAEAAGTGTQRTISFLGGSNNSAISFTSNSLNAVFGNNANIFYKNIQSEASIRFSGLDLGISRNAAGVMELNNGTAGTFRDLIVRNLRMSAPTGVPATAGATGTEGSIRWDADYIYICTATNTWKRVAIATW